MEINIRQISSLDKIFDGNKRKYTEISAQKVLRGERFSYQLEITCTENKSVSVSVDSTLKDFVQIYRERAVICDMPTSISRNKSAVDDNYLTFQPAQIPDILEPLTASRNRIRISEHTCLLWVRTDIPKDAKPGIYDINIEISDDDGNSEKAVMTVEILDINLPKADLKYTQWFYNDCIASYYNAEIYSERHWQLIESFIETAADCGINMLLSPVHNPPLDTAVGLERPNVQLVKISMDKDMYSFDFSRFERWVSICKKYGIRYYEIPHFFSQWGSESAPNIYIDGMHKFGAHTACDSAEYVDFLNQYMHALINELKRLGIYENTYFHISDEPGCDNIDSYKKCYDIINGISKNLKLIDALSDVDFYKKGLVNIPIPASNAIKPFLEENIAERWVYYCCAQGNSVSNRFIAMSSFRNRIIGIQMYKFGINGFLQWGYNFYYSEKSEYEINPYVTTSADYAFPSGDAFSVYPGKEGALPSIRSFVFFEALQDMALCKLLEDKTHRDYVIKLIDETAKKDIRFSDLPEDESYLFKLRERIISELQAV